MFESINTNYRSLLGTAGEPTRIEGKGTICTKVNGVEMRLANVLYIPALDGNLLATHELHSHSIGNTHFADDNYKFFRDGEIVA